MRAGDVSYLFAGPDGRGLAHTMSTLGEVFAIKPLLLEGGAATTSLFLKFGLINDISVPV